MSERRNSSVMKAAKSAGRTRFIRARLPRIHLWKVVQAGWASLGAGTTAAGLRAGVPTVSVT
jgi:hypothetical protein